MGLIPQPRPALHSGRGFRITPLRAERERSMERSHRRPVVASVVQAGSVLFDTPRTLEKLAELAKAARERGAQVVLFPEAFVGGYPKGRDFGVVVGRRSPEGREEVRRYFEGAIAIPGPEMEYSANVAR